MPQEVQHKLYGGSFFPAHSMIIRTTVIEYILEKCPTARIRTVTWPVVENGLRDFTRVAFTVSNFGKPNFWGQVVIPGLEYLAKKMSCDFDYDLEWPVLIVLNFDYKDR